jgi:hypothetical protein
MANNYVYIIGYGSLLNFNSIEKTIFNLNVNEDYIHLLKQNFNNININKILLYEKKIRIAYVKNLKRSFCVPINYNNKITNSWISLGTYPKKNSIINCTIFPVNENQLIELDSREKYYKKIEINYNDIEIIKGDKLNKKKKIFCYIIDKKLFKKPSLKYPILQSYIDICIKGCLYIDFILKNKNFEFTKQFIQNTYNWKKLKYWINDRIYSRRPYHYINNSLIIDKLLTNYIFKKFKQNQDRQELRS